MIFSIDHSPAIIAHCILLFIDQSGIGADPPKHSNPRLKTPGAKVNYASRNSIRGDSRRFKIQLRSEIHQISANHNWNNKEHKQHNHIQSSGSTSADLKSRACSSIPFIRHGNPWALLWGILHLYGELHLQDFDRLFQIHFSPAFVGHRR